MGVALAAEAAARGADVVLVLGPGTVGPPRSVARTVRVETSEEMRTAVLEAFDTADALVMAAAVADFRPERVEERKLKTQAGLPDLRLVPTADILREAAARKADRVVIGFAAETN